MKTAVSSYSFHTLTGSGEYREIDLIRLAKEMGFDGIEFAEIHPDQGENKADYAARLREESEKVQLPIINYAVGADLVRDTDEAFEREIERLCGEVDIADLLGSPMMRHDVTGGVKNGDPSNIGFDGVLPRLIQGCTAVTEYAREKGIKTMTENHGFFCQESRRVERLVTGVHNENYGVLLDMGNFLCADENPAEAAGRLADHVFHVHAKDFHVKSGNGFVPPDAFFMTRGGNLLRGAVIGHGDVPVLQCLRILKNHGYDGFVTVEFEGIEEAKRGVQYGLNALKQMFDLVASD